MMQHLHQLLSAAQSQSAEFAVRARWVLPVDRPPLDGGTVTIRRDRIVAVGRPAAAQDSWDLGDVLLMPGLVNPHVHLEFSQVAEPLGRPGARLADWIPEVVRWRRAQTAGSDAADGERWRAALRTGLTESVAAGVTLLGENLTRSGAASRRWPSVPRVAVFRELLGFPADRASEQKQRVREHLAWLSRQRPACLGGLAPHAPYTVRWEVLEYACERAGRAACPLSMHLAESEEELELLAAGTGPLRQCLERLEAWDDAPHARRTTARDYLHLLARAPRALVVHGNYLPRADWSLLADARDRMTVVYCPRTHARFAHRPYPLADMLAAGVRVAVGTDGRSSNPDLDLLAELQAVASRHADVPPATVLRLGTWDAATALGCQADVGSLTPGKRADLVIVPLPPNARQDPVAALLRATIPWRLTLCGGQVVTVVSEVP